MRFADLQGNDELKRVLARMADSGRIPHAILLEEEDGGGAFPLALAFLQYLYCADRSGGDSCGTCPSCNRISKLIHPDSGLGVQAFGGVRRRVPRARDGGPVFPRG